MQPRSSFAPAHASFHRLLNRQEPDPETLGAEDEPLIAKHPGVLVIDDATLDHLDARHLALVTPHWSGTHRKTVRGINLISLVWTDGQTKNDHFWKLMLLAKGRGFSPRHVLFESWSASLENLKPVRDFGWLWLTRFKGHRQVTSTGHACTRDEVALGGAGKVLPLRGYGWVRVFRFDAPDGDREDGATNDLTRDEGTRLRNADLGFAIANSPRERR